MWRRVELVLCGTIVSRAMTLPCLSKNPKGCGFELIVVWCVSCASEAVDKDTTESGVAELSSSTEAGSSGGSNSVTGTDTAGSSGSAAHQLSTGGDGMTGGESSTSDADRGSSSTGEPGAVCGNGIVEGDETCDDANEALDDGCQYCTKDSIVFVSSEVYQGFALGGLFGADQKCRSLAAKAGLVGFETFRAWLSNAGESVSDRLFHSPGRYKLVNGVILAKDWSALTSGALDNPIDVDEYSQTQDLPVWTGTLANGQPALGSGFCGDWSDNEGLKFGGVGLNSSTTSMWSFYEEAECGAEIPIYCVEQVG